MPLSDHPLCYSCGQLACFLVAFISSMLINLGDQSKSFVIVSIGHLAKDMEKSPNFRRTKIECIRMAAGKSLISRVA